MRTDGPLHVLRDTDGVAHVRATTLADGFRGQGWAAAQDRIWQMELDRRRALGTLAAAVGGAASVALDTLHRRLGIAAHARASHDALGDDARAMLSAYAEGVTAWLAEAAAGEHRLPVELELLGIAPEPWEPWHSLAVHEVRHLAMGTFESKVWRSGLVANLGPDLVARLWPSTEDVVIDPDQGPVRRPLDPLGAMRANAPALADLGRLLDAADVPDDAGGGEQASNNLVLGPSRTATGRPILAGDPHRAIDLPNVYWPNQVTVTGADGTVELDVIGLSFPGIPAWPHFGHNRSVAWCITHGMADDQDVSVVHLRRDPSDPAAVSVRTSTAWAPVERRTEQVACADGDPVDVEVLVTHRGPVVAGGPVEGAQDGRPWAALALAWTATAARDTTHDALLPMARAGSVAELDAAFGPWVVPVNNVLVADVAGRIGYRMRGRLAVRGEGHDRSGWTAVPGDDPAHDWTSFVADADLPRFLDPADDVVVTANNPIALGGPYVSHDWAHRTRAARLTEATRDRADWDVPDVASLLCDEHSAVAAALAARLQAAGGTHPADRAALGLLDGWDATMAADSPAAALVGAVRGELVRLLVAELGLHKDRLPGVPGPGLHTTLRLANARIATWVTDPEIVDDDVLRAALRLAVRTLEQFQGSAPAAWRWGPIHASGWAHPLVALRPDLADRLPLPPVVPLGGDTECVRATSTAPPSTVACNAQVARYVMDVGDWDRSGWILPHGVSGDARSPHHADMVARWSGDGLAPMRFSAAAVDAATESVTTLG